MTKKNITVRDLVSEVKKYLVNLHEERTKKGQKTKWIEDLLGLSAGFHENKLNQIIDLLGSASEDDPVSIGHIAWIVKDLKFRQFEKDEYSRINMCVEVYGRLLIKLGLLKYKKNGLYMKKNRDIEEEDDDKPDTCTGLWLNKDKWKLEGFNIKPKKESYIWEESVEYDGAMSGDKYTQQKCRKYDRCTETINLLNKVSYKFDKELCSYKAKAPDKYTEFNKWKQWEFWEGQVMKRVYLVAKNVDEFYVSFKPEKRLRVLIREDVGNYIGLKNIRHRIEFAHNEVFEPDAVED